MLNLIIDTNIYWRHYKRNSAGFKIISSLSNEDLLKLHIPYIVLREFQTQQRDKCDDAVSKCLSSLKEIREINLPDDRHKFIDKMSDELKSIKDSITQEAEMEFINWAKSIDANIEPLCAEQAIKAFEAYFVGKPPLTIAKTRDDIPDSFLVRSLEKIANTHDEVHFISDDKNVRNAAQSISNVKAYSHLHEFIESDTIQNLLQEIDPFKDIKKIISELKGNKEIVDDLEDALSNEIGNEIMWKAFHDISIPDDNNEATIDSYGEVENIKLDYNDTTYYGDGIIAIPFKLNITVFATYYIFKADYYSMEHVRSVSDHNKHYFEAEDEFFLSVSGLVTLRIDRDKYLKRGLKNSLDSDSFNIDEISEISLEKNNDQNLI